MTFHPEFRYFLVILPPIDPFIIGSGSPNIDKDMASDQGNIFLKYDENQLNSFNDTCTFVSRGIQTL